MRKITRAFSLLLALTLIVTMLAGCQQNPTPDNAGQLDETDDAIKRGGTIITTASKEPVWYWFCGSSGGVEIVFSQLLSDHLVGFDENGEFIGRVAESWETSEDGLTWTFHIRKNVKWHDGEPLTARDCEFSYYYCYSEDLGTTNTGELNSDIVSKVEATDDYTLVITLTKPNNSLLSLLCGEVSNAFSLIPKHIWENIAPSEVTNQKLETYMVNCGPFKFAEYVTGEYIRLERNEEYYNGAPYVDEWYIRMLSDTAANQNAFEAGELTMLKSNAADYNNSMIAKGASYVQAANGMNRQIKINYVAHPEFKDKTWAKAFKMLIDKETICDVIFPGTVPYDGPFTPVDTYFTEDVVSIPYDVDAAKQIIESYGYTMGADGYYQKDGQTLSYNALVENSYQDLYLLLQDSWKKAGVKLELFIYDSDTYYSDDVFINLECHDWLIQQRDNMFGPDSLNYYTAYCRPDVPYHVAGAGYNNEEVNALFEDALVNSDQSAVKEDLEKVQKLLAEDMAMYYIGYCQSTLLYDSNLCMDEAGFRMWNQFNFAHPEKLYFKNN